jgi:cytochrome c-type biogenesis protein CcmH/NrfG
VRNWGHEQRTTEYCLGQPPHPVEQGKIICGVCGRLVRGVTLGIYQVQRFLGQGRSGDAYLAQHHRRHIQVVMKVFPPDSSTMGLWDVARQQALLLTRLQHPSLLPVYSCSFVQLETPSLDVGSVSAPVKGNIYLLTIRPFIANTLAYVLNRSMATSDRDVSSLLFKIIQQIGEALSVVHAHGLAHGALVPGNVLIDSQTNCWIADSGLARLHAPSPPYLPPELLSASNNDRSAERVIAVWNATTPLSDQYMFAVLCQNMLNEHLTSQNYAVRMRALQRATAPYPEDRFPSINAFVQALLETEPTSKQPSASGRIFTARPIPASLVPDAQPAGEGTREKRVPSRQMVVQQAGTLAERVKGLERLAGKLFTDHRYQEAQQAYEQALSLDAGNATLWMALGDTFLATEQYTEALSAYEKSIVLNPADGETWMNCGTALEALGRRREAQTCYERASQLRNGMLL